MKSFLSCIAFIATQGCFGQVKNLSSLPAYDCNLKKLMAIIAQPTILLTPDNNSQLESITNEYCADLGNNCIKKTMSEMQDTDYQKPLFIIGKMKDFKTWLQFNLPIKKVPGGFMIKDRIFADSLDGFAYIDPRHIIVSGNSLHALKDVQLAFAGGYDLQVLQKGKITFVGNKTKGQFNWFNLQDLKTTNYIKKISSLFDGIYVSKTFKDTTDYEVLKETLNNYVQQFLHVYDITMPAKKVSWFVHSNMMEYGMMSGMFGFTCPGNNSTGFSIRGEIHTHGANTGLLKHEYSHFLFDNNIPQDHNPAFFVEGVVEYVTNLNDTVLFRQRVAIANTFRDSLNYADLIINNKDFYGHYSSANYSVCSIFVKYLVDKFGVAALKKFCLAGDKKIASRDIFNSQFEGVVEGYKHWLDEQ